MQLSNNTIKQTIVQIMTVLNSKQFLCELETNNLLSLLMVGIQSDCAIHKNQIHLFLRTLMEIQRKTYNMTSKLLVDFWKIFINFLFKIQLPSKLGHQNCQSIIKNLSNLQDFYNAFYSIQQVIIEQKQTLNPSTQDFYLFLTLWQKLFAISDLKTVHYALISLALIFNHSSIQQYLKSNESSIFFECLNKIALNIVKFNEKIKDFDTFQHFIKLLSKIQSKFRQKYEKQINKGVQQLHQTYKLSQVLKSSHPFLNTWENLVISQFFCIHKKKQGIEDIQKVMRLLENLRKTFYFQRAINYNRQNQNKAASVFIFHSSQFHYMLFCAFVQVWVNFKLVYETQILKQSNCQNKQKLSEDAQKIRVFLKEILKILTKRQINLLMTRQMIKNLRIFNVSSAVLQWKQVFALMQQLLKSYPQNKTIIQFTDEKSYISKRFSPAIKYPFTILLKVKEESIPSKQQKILIQFIDSSSKEKIIITMRNYQKDSIIFSFVKVSKNNIWGKEQKEFKWLQYESNSIEIILKSNKIKMFINQNDHLSLSMQNTLSKVDEIVLCDRQTGMGSTISQLLQFKVIQYHIFGTTQKTQVDLVPFICPKFLSASKDSMKENLQFNKCKKILQQSFISLNQNLGDLQLFMVILFHALKKLKSQQDELLQLIRFVLKLMQEFTVCKHVQNKQLCTQEKQLRRKTIQCLSWFFAKQSKSVFVIFELMRFLYIRGNRENNEILKFLCNFSYWKQFKLDKQMVIVMKIKQLLKQASKQEQKINNLKYCRLLLFDMILYFKETGFKIVDKESCLRLHQAIFQTVYEQVKEIIQINSNCRKVKHYMLEIFNFLEYIIRLISCLVNRKIHQENLDMALAVQLTMLLKDLSKLLFVSKERKLICKQDIDLALQSLFKKGQQQSVLPLSLNAQQACDQRFTMYLSNILSQSKSLIALFDTQMAYFEQTKIKFYPIYADTHSICTENKIHSNIVQFDIYMSMLSQKSWNFMLFCMPPEQYSQRFCQNIWRISFYDLFKQKKYFPKVCKMLEQTPLPTNEYCLMKIFEAVLFCPYFEKQHLYRIIKSSNFTKSICPFKIQQMLIKYFKKLQNEPSNNKAVEIIGQNRPRENSIALDQQKIYFVLAHATNVEFESCTNIIEFLKCRKAYSKYNLIVYEVVLKSLIKHINQKKEYRKLHKQKTNYFQSEVIDNLQKKRSRLYSNDQTQLGSEIYQEKSITTFDSVLQKQNKQSSSALSEQNFMIIKPEFASFITEALQFYLTSFTIENIKSFFGLSSIEDLEALRENFIINVEGMIKALKDQQANKASFQFEKYLSFIEVYLQKYSQHLVHQTFPTFITKEARNSLQNEDETKKGRKKVLFRTVIVDLIKNSTQFFLEEINQRRLQLHNLQHTWSLISHRHSYFWNLFISSQKYYSLSDITSDLGERYLLKISTEKPKIELPKMMNKYSLICSVSLLSDKIAENEQSEPSTLFDDCDELLRTQLEQVEAKTKDKIRKGSANIIREIKTKKFRVLLITNNKIYQGFLFMLQPQILRFEQTYPLDKFYEKISAHEEQKRNDDEVEKQPMCFNILLRENTKMLFRKYLFYDTGLQIFSNERSSFFIFDSDQKRNRFCLTYLKDFKVLTYEMMKKLILQQAQKWRKGLLSNYQYLMKLNQYGNRSLNDLSQYYVMPWTICQFERCQIDRQFLNDSNYFRDLSKPMGRLFENKWKQIESNFKMSFNRYNRQQSVTPGMIQPFLYGSFYSNPAIVTNYMIRVQPFSSLHYKLQSEKIDHADRLFYQVSDQYLSISRNISDIKQLIPEFYNNAQFLKNKSMLNLGARQNKEIVNDVRLPKWASNAEEFIFKMRYFLESSLISKYLHAWIDLIFGQKAKKQNAIQADNLFMSQVYGPKESLTDEKEKIKRRLSQIQKDKQNQNASKSSQVQEVDMRIVLNKQFGQLPFTLFDCQHPSFENIDDYYSFKGISQHLFTMNSHQTNDTQFKIDLCQNFCLISTPHTLDLIDTGAQDYTQKQNLKLVSQLCLPAEIKFCSLISSRKIGSFLPYVFYINQKENKLNSRFIKKSKFFGSLELRDQHCVVQCSNFKWINDQILLVSIKNTLKVYSFDQCSLTSYPTSDKKLSNIKLQQSKAALPVREFLPFSQHKTDIMFIQTNDILKLILTIDALNKIFILKYYPHELREINNFQLRGLRFDQQVIKIMMHKFSIILCFTNQNRLLAYTFYGQQIGMKQLRFKLTQNNLKQQLPNCIEMFDKNSSSQILIGTNLGNLWKIDIFEFFKSYEPIQQKDLWFQKISINNKQHQLDIKDLKIKRYGRHWQIYLISLNKQNKKIISKVQSLSLKRITFNTQK